MYVSISKIYIYDTAKKQNGNFVWLLGFQVDIRSLRKLHIFSPLFGAFPNVGSYPG